MSRQLRSGRSKRRLPRSGKSARPKTRKNVTSRRARAPARQASMPLHDAQVITEIRWAAGASREVLPTAVCAICLGFSFAFALFGVVEGWAGALNCAHALRRIVAGGISALALGVILPRRIAARVGRRKGHAAPDMASSPSFPICLLSDMDDRAWQWIVLSASSLVGGISILFLPALLRLAVSVHSWSYARWEWSDFPAGALSFSLITAALAVPFGSAGVALASCHRLRGDRLKCAVSATALVLFGAAAGIALRIVVPLPLVFPFASLPLLVTCILAIRSSAAAERNVRNQDAKSRFQPPICSDRHPQLLRCTIYGISLALPVFTLSADRLLGFPSLASGHALPLTFLLLGIGIFVAEFREGIPNRSFSELGLGCLTVAFTASASQWATAWTFAGGSMRSALGAMSVVFIGYAFALTRQMLLDRVAHPRSVEIAWLGRSLLVAAVVTALPQSLWPIGRVEPSFHWVACAALLGLGGLLTVQGVQDSSKPFTKLRIRPA